MASTARGLLLIPFRLLLFFVVILACGISVRREGVQHHGIPLEPRSGATFVSDIAAESDPVFVLNLKRNEFAQITVDQQGMDLAISIYDPNDKLIHYADWRWNGVESASWVANSGGPYQIKLSGHRRHGIAGKFVLRVSEVRPRSTVDPIQTAAEKDSTQAKQELERGAPPPKLDAPIRSLLKVWRELNYRPGIGQVLNLRGFLEDASGKPKTALETFQEALTFRTDAAGMAETLHNMAAAESAAGELRKAADLYQQALKLRREAGDLEGIPATLSNLAAVHTRLSETDEAIRMLEEAIRTSQQIANPKLEAQGRVNLSATLSSISETEDALTQSRSALALLDGESDQRGRAYALSGMGQIYASLADYPRALTNLQSALLLMQKIGDKRGEGRVLSQIGVAHYLSGQSKFAIEYLDRAVGVLRRVQDRFFEGQTRQNLSRAYLATGDLVRATDYNAEALMIANSLGDVRGEASALRNLAQIESSRQEVGRATEHLRKARRLFQRIRNRDNEADCLLALARLSWDSGHRQAALLHIEDALKIIESQRGKVTSSRLRLSYFAARRDYYDFYIDWLMQMDKEQPSRSLSAAAFEASERARARLLLDTIPLSRINIRNTRDTNLDDRKRRMHREINGLVQQLQTAQLSEAAINERNKRLESLLLELDDVQDQIAAVDLRYQNLISPSPLHLAEIQSQLRVDGTDTLLLEYSLGKDRSFLWAVTASSYHAFSDLPSRSEIEQLVRRLYESVDAHAANESAQALQGAATQYQKTSALLSQKLLGPIADFLNTKRVVVVADGALQFLPFAVLPMPKDPAGSPLIAEHEVVNLPSAAVLATLRLEKRSRSAPRQITVVADPVYSPEDPRVVRDKRAVTTSRSPGRVVDTAVDFVDRVRGGTAFSRLIYSRREARAILSLVSAEQARFALDFDADLRTASNPELTSVRILHFAVHAVLDSLRPSLSSLVFSLVDPHGQEKPGFLPLYEIYNLDLPAELVVLSACRTAIGAEIQGEGLESLARGFMHSGSSRLVASLWRVDDESTAELMKSFYRGILANGLTPAAALREAQNQMRKSRWHDPYYWAGFIFIGDWR